jgi:hypothetical protein
MTVSEVEFVSDKMKYIVQRSRLGNTVVLNMHSASMEKSGDSKDSSYAELKQVFDYFPKYYMKILLGGFNAKVGRDNIFKPTNFNKGLYQDNN